MVNLERGSGEIEEMGWLFLAIVLEVIGTTNMKLAQGFTRWVPSVLMFVFYAASFSAMAMALKKLDVSMTYAIWSGLGTALITAIGILWFQEPVTALKLGSIGLIILGVVGLHLGNSH